MREFVMGKWVRGGDEVGWGRLGEKKMGGW